MAVTINNWTRKFYFFGGITASHLYTQSTTKYSHHQQAAHNPL